MPSFRIPLWLVDLVTCACVTVAVAIALLPTVPHAIPGGDSGELVAEACQFGVAHPPGYPLFIYFAAAAMRVFSGTHAYRVNLACALLSALTAGLVCKTILLVGRRVCVRVCGVRQEDMCVSDGHHAVAAGAALVVAWMPLMWLYSIGAEVFALNNFLCAAFALYAVAYGEALAGGASASTRRQWIMGGAALCGLLLCNQHTSVLLIVPVAAWVALTHWDIVAVSDVPIFAACLFAGLLPYAHMPISQIVQMRPGSWGDTRTLRGFFRHFLRQDYGTLKLYSRSSAAAEGFLARTAAYVSDTLHAQLPSPLLGAVVVMGLICCLAAMIPRKVSVPGAPELAPRKAGKGSSRDLERISPSTTSGMNAARGAHAGPAVISGAYIFYFCVFHALSNMPLSDQLLFGVHQRFWLQPALLLAVLLGAGGMAAAGAIGKIAVNVLPQGGSRVLVGGLFASLALGGARQQWTRTAPAMQHSNNTVVEDYGRALLEPLPRDAILITAFDMQWTATRYLQSCTGLRADVSLFNAPVMSFDWFAGFRAAYPKVTFPGTHLVSHMTATHASGGFSLADFLASNSGGPRVAQELAQSYAANPPHPDFVPRDLVLAASATESPPAVVLAGSYLFQKDEAHLLQFEFIPLGISQVAVPKYANAYSAAFSWRNITKASFSDAGLVHRKTATIKTVTHAERAWGTVQAAYNASLADVQRYDNSTWELATRIDFWNQAVEYATWLLEWALQAPAGAKVDGTDGPINATATLQAARILEHAMHAQAEHGMAILPNTYKNLGLAYVRLVRHKHELPTHIAWPPAAAQHPWTDDADGRAAGESEFRGAAAQRVLALWRHFSKLPEARDDLSLPTIVQVVRVLEQAAARTAAA